MSQLELDSGSTEMTQDDMEEKEEKEEEEDEYDEDDDDEEMIADENDKEIVPSEFVEALLRLSTAKFKRGTLAQRMTQLYHDHMMPLSSNVSDNTTHRSASAFCLLSFFSFVFFLFSFPFFFFFIFFSLSLVPDFFFFFSFLFSLLPHLCSVQ